METDRTRLRPFGIIDVHETFSWFSDPEVMRYIPLGPDRTVADTAACLTRYMAHQAQHGFSKWAIVEKSQAH